MTEYLFVLYYKDLLREERKKIIALWLINKKKIGF
jgi:hypothetical protein